MYRELHPEDQETTEDDLTVVTVEKKVLTAYRQSIERRAQDVWEASVMRGPQWNGEGKDYVDDGKSGVY